MRTRDDDDDCFNDLGCSHSHSYDNGDGDHSHHPSDHRARDHYDDMHAAVAAGALLRGAPDPAQRSD